MHAVNSEVRKRDERSSFFINIVVVIVMIAVIIINETLNHTEILWCSI